MEKGSQLDAAITSFLEWGSPGWSPKTREAYGTALRSKLLKWADGRITRLSQIDSKVLGEYDAHLRTQPIAEVSRKTYLRHLNHFLSWGKEHSDGQGVKIQLPKTRRKTRDVFSREEMKVLEASAQLERDKLIIRIACDTGMRLGELVNLRVSDVVADGKAHYLLVRGKTGERTTTISPSLYNRLSAYRKHGRGLATSDALFVSVRRPYGPLEEKGIYGIIKDAHARSGILKRCHPHLLRHSNITARCESEQNLAMVSNETGASMAVLLEHYSHPSLQARYESTLRIFGDD